MRNKLIYLLYVTVSILPDIRILKFWFNFIIKLRPKVLNLLDTMYISKNVHIYSNVRISRMSNLIINNNVCIKENCTIGGNCTIGENTLILANTKIDASGEVIIGKNTHIGRENDIYSHSHDVSNKAILVNESKEIFQKTIIGDNVMLFSRVGIMSGVTLEDNVVIGYGSVVTKDCSANCIYAGVPSKKIGERK